MNRAPLMLVAGLAALLGACSDSAVSVSSVANTTVDDTTDATTVDDTTDATTDAMTALADGVEFTDPDGRYSVVYPSEPTASPGTAPLAVGGSVDFVAYIAGDSSHAYVTNCLDYATTGQTDIQVDLEGARDGALANLNGTLTSSKDIEQQGRSGLEFTGTVVGGGQEGSVVGRLFEDGLALCQVMAVAVTGDTSDVSPAFLDSFQFLEPAA